MAKLFFETKRGRIVLVGILIVAAFFVLFRLPSVLKPQEEKGKSLSVAPPGEVTSLILNGLPADFPSEITLESGGKVVKSYKVENQGITQTTAVYESEKTASQNFLFYKALLENNGWQFTSLFEQSNPKQIYASRGQEGVTVIISQDSESKTVTVGIVYSSP